MKFLKNISRTTDDKLLSALLAVGLSATLFSATMLTLAPTPAHAYDVNARSAVNVDAESVGLHGYDPVAYFKEGAAVKGMAAFNAKHGGVTYYFANPQDRDAFKANPAQYEPQFGGFCAMGVALGRKLDGDPQAWRIVDGKLYLNVNKDIQKKWLEDVPGHISKAKQEWPGIKDKAPKDL